MAFRWMAPALAAIALLTLAGSVRAEPKSPPAAAAEPESESESGEGEAIEGDAVESAVPAVENAEPPGASTDVRRITVKKRSSALTSSGRYIDARIIATQPKRSAEDLLRLVPGMLIVQHGNQGKGHQFYVRGFDAVHGSDVEFLAGDIPLNEASNVHAHGYLDLSFIPPEVVMGIDARKGSYGVDQGNFATAATIRYDLGVAQPERGTRISYEIGSTNRHRAALVYAPKDRPESTFLALDAMHDDGYGENRRVQRLGGLSQLRLFERGPVQLDGLAGAYAARFGLPGLVRLDDFNAKRRGFYDAYSDDTHGESMRALVGLTTRVDTGKTQLSITTYGQGRRLVLDENYTGFLQNPIEGDRHAQTQDAGSLGVRAQWQYRVHPRVQLQVHANWQGDAIDERQDELLPTGQPWATTRDLMVHQNTWGIGPAVRAVPTSWLTIDGGVRFDVFHDAVQDRLQDDRISRQTFWAISPRVAMRAELGRKWALFTAYGRGFRSPDARAITLPREPPENVDLDVYAGGEPRMTLTDAVEIGTRFAPNRLFDAGVTAFGTFIQRESVFDHVSGFNIERSGTRRLGAEADVQIHPTHWMDLGFDVTGVYGRFVETDKPIPGAPPLLVSTFGSLAHRSGWHAGWRWFLLGPRPLSYGARAGIVTVLDASVGYRTRHFGIDLFLDNILGLKWREGEYNYASHWDATQPRSRIPTVHYIAGYPRMIRAAITVWF